MVRSRNWPDLWWQISKIRNIQVVGIYDPMKCWRFETNRISNVATAQPQSQKPVFDFDLTWWPDLWWPEAESFTQGVKFNCKQVLKKWRRCAPPFFRYPRKTGGVGSFCPLQCACLGRATLCVFSVRVLRVVGFCGISVPEMKFSWLLKPGWATLAPGDRNHAWAG